MTEYEERQVWAEARRLQEKIEVSAVVVLSVLVILSVLLWSSVR